MTPAQYPTEKSAPAEVTPRTVRLLVGRANAPESVQDVPLTGLQLVQVAIPDRGLRVTFTEGGVVVTTSAGCAHSLSWGHLVTLATTGELTSRAYGTVCDGSLHAWYPSRTQAEDAATDLRASYGRVELIEIDPDIAAKLAR